MSVETTAEKSQSNARDQAPVQQTLETSQVDGADAKRAMPDAAKDKRSALALANVANSPPPAAGGDAKTSDKPKDAEIAAEHKVNVNALSEEQCKDIVYLQAGKGVGRERYDANRKPPVALDPKKDNPAEDSEYDFETWEAAKHRLEMLEVEHDEHGAGLVHTSAVDPDEHEAIEGEGVPKNSGMWDRASTGGVSTSSNNASRAERSAADAKLADAQSKVDEIQDTKGHAGIGAAKRAEKQADKQRDATYDKTKDPLGDDKKKIEKDEQAERRELIASQTEALDKVKESETAYEAAQRRVANPATGEGSAEKNEQAKADAAKAKEELQQALAHAQAVGANRSLLAKAYDALKMNTEVELRGDLITKAATTGNVGVFNEKHDGEKGPLGSTNEGETNVLSARGDAKARLGVGKSGIVAEAALGGKATLVDAKEQWKWEMPGHFLGEAVNFKLFLEVAGMIGVEAHAQLKANVGKMNPKEPKIDMNAVSAGVDGFAGMKASIGVGAAFEWQKQNPDAYKAKTAEAGKVIVDLISAGNPPLGFILRQMNGDLAAKNLMDHLMSWGQAGTVPLAAVEAVIEGSAGIGGQAHAAIGLRGGHFDFMTQANATWGVGVGGKVKVSMDVVEGPKFALITLGELRPVAIKFAQEEVAKGISTGATFVSSLVQHLSDWWHSKDKAHELVNHKVPSVLPGAKNAELIQALFGWYCNEDDQFAIVDVMIEMKKHGQLDALSPQLKQQIMEKTDGAHHHLAASILGWQPWK